MLIDTIYFDIGAFDAMLTTIRERVIETCSARRTPMRMIRKSAHRVDPAERDLIAYQQAVLAETAADERHNVWALEMLGRRNAVARWRGLPGCSVRDVIQALDALPA
jgi:hypothetical protein